MTSIDDSVSQKGETVNTHSMQNGKKYAVSDDSGAEKITVKDVRAVQSIGRKSVNDFTSEDIKKTESFARRYFKEMGAKSPFFRAWFGDWRANDTSKITVANKKGAARGKIKNRDTGWDIQVSGKVFNETKGHDAPNNRKALPYLDYINSIVENAVLLDSYAIPENKAKSPNSVMMHSLYAIADMGTGKELVKLYIEELNDVNIDGTMKRAYQLQNINKVLPESNRFSNNSLASSIQQNTYTVSQLFDLVKQKDKNFRPKTSSKVVNEDGTPRIMYHGSPNEFTVFDIKKAKSAGTLGKGFYFTDSNSHASTYERDGNLYNVYLDIKNPLDADTKTSRKEMRAFLEAVAENEDYSIENYGTYDIDEILRSVNTSNLFLALRDINTTAIGDFAEAVQLYNEVNGTDFDGIITDTETVVFRANQIKSATDNIGTFDSGNDDIRYAVSDEKSGSGDGGKKEKYFKPGSNRARDIDIVSETENGRKNPRLMRNLAESQFTSEETASEIAEEARSGNYSFTSYSDKAAASQVNRWFLTGRWFKDL